MINVDLMVKIRQQITRHPESHDQDNYESYCGTTRCIAGWAIFLATGKGVWEQEGVDACELGAEILGLTDEEAESLFWEFDNNLAIQRLDELIENGRNQ